MELLWITLLTCKWTCLNPLSCLDALAGIPKYKWLALTYHWLLFNQAVYYDRYKQDQCFNRVESLSVLVFIDQNKSAPTVCRLYSIPNPILSYVHHLYGTSRKWLQILLSSFCSTPLWMDNPSWSEGHGLVKAPSHLDHYVGALSFWVLRQPSFKVLLWEPDSYTLLQQLRGARQEGGIKSVGVILWGRGRTQAALLPYTNAECLSSN